MKKIFYFLALTLFIIVGPLITFACTGDSCPPNSISITNPLTNGVNTLPELVTLILNNVIMPLATVFIVVMIIYSGFKYITAQGNAAKIKDASQGLLYVLIGAAVLLGAAGISAAVSGTICGPLINCG